MNEVSHIAAGVMPRMKSVNAAEKLCVQVEWAEGPRAGRTENVDLAPLINSLKFYKPLRNSPSLFGTVHLIDDGEALAWGETETIDMAATSVERLAKEMMRPEDMRVVLAHLDYTHEKLAAMLGYSRRQVENFLSGTKPIPRVCALACHALQYRHNANAYNMNSVYMGSASSNTIQRLNADIDILCTNLSTTHALVAPELRPAVTTHDPRTATGLSLFWVSAKSHIATYNDQ